LPKNIRWEEYAQAQLSILHEINAVIDYGPKAKRLQKVTKLSKKSRKLWEEYTRPIREQAKK